LSGEDGAAAGEALIRLGLEIFRIHGRMLAITDQMAASAGQTAARMRILLALRPGPRTVSQIARDVGLRRQSVQRLTDLLVDQGVARYQVNPNHKRARLVTLTESGAEALGDLLAARLDWAQSVTHGLAPERLDSATELLKMLGHRLRMERGGRTDSPDG
jgi:DNA-binding MarR family transcriptional regulator